MSLCRRWFCLAVFLGGLAAFTVSAPAPAQSGGGNDRIFFRDRAKDGQLNSATGELKESPAGVQVVAGGKVQKTIAPADVIRIEFSNLPGLPDTDRLSMNSAENREVKDLKDAVKTRADYAAMIKKSGTNEKTRRVLEYREAQWAAKVADYSAAADFEKAAREAIAQLQTFYRANPKTWEFWPAGATAARLQAELKDFSGAATTWAALAKNADLSSDLKA
ncbi:MAG: hypothetical protein ACRCZF_22200, partial [Gemmataceae bacterium]